MLQVHVGILVSSKTFGKAHDEVGCQTMFDFAENVVDWQLVFTKPTPDRQNRLNTCPLIWYRNFYFGHSLYLGVVLLSWSLGSVPLVLRYLSFAPRRPLVVIIVRACPGFNGMCYIAVCSPYKGITIVLLNNTISNDKIVCLYKNLCLAIRIGWTVSRGRWGVYFWRNNQRTLQLRLAVHCLYE